MENIQTLLRQGHYLFFKNNFAEALKRYKQCLEIHPNDVEVLVNIGITLNILNSYEQALPYFERALELDPDIDIWANYASCLLDIGRINETVEYLEKAIKQYSQDECPLAYSNLGYAYELLGAYNAAIVNYDIAIEQDYANEYLSTRIRRGELYYIVYELNEKALHDFHYAASMGYFKGYCRCLLFKGYWYN